MSDALLSVLMNRATGPRKFTEEEQKLRDLWNRQQLGEPVLTPGGPVFAPKPPGMFQPEPTIVGQELGKMSKKFFDIAPNLKGKAPRVMYGPGGAAISAFKDSGDMPVENFVTRPLNLLGATKVKTGEINLNPNLGDPAYLRRRGMISEYGDSPPDQVLAHEYTHASGYLNEQVPEAAEQIIRMMKRNQ